MKTNVYEAEVGTSNKNRPRGADESGSPKPNLDKEEVMKRMQAAGAPGAAHKALDALVGNWKAEVKCWMEPGSPATVSQATSKANWILGGRFLDEEFRGEMMGKPFTGRCLFGFNNLKQKYQSVWVDDINTAMMTSEGKAENGNQLITLEGKADCPGTGQKDVPMKQVIRVLGPDKHVWEMFHDGQKRMEITYTRQ